jgi:DNA replication protein DnaC
MLQLGTARSRGRLQECGARAVFGPSLAVVDELGYLPFGCEEARLFFQVIADRYERSSTIITSNLPFAQWSTALADNATLSAALLDGLLHHAHIVQIRGESNQMKHKQQAGTTPQRQKLRRMVSSDSVG